MNRSNLIEIKKGKTGEGLLIENDGYISLPENERKKINESIESDGAFHCPHPFIVSAVFQKFGIENANGRIYPEDVLKKQVELYQRKIQEVRAYGELNHPSESVIDLGRLCMNIVELHWEGRTLVGKLEVETSPGFRKYGLCTCIGDQLANHLINGYKVGVSSRGVGSVEQKGGKYIVGEDYELICWDVVSDPSTPNAWIEDSDEKLQPYLEGKEVKKTKINENSEKFSKFSEWLG